MTSATRLTDSFDRTINYLRLSVTDRCDFRCMYCMSEDMTFLPRKAILSLEELGQIGTAFASLGVTKIRITGGEPLVRQGIVQLVAHLAREGLPDLSMTTNGARLAQFAPALADAGLHRVNISLDSLQPDRFRALTRTGNLQDVLSGIQAAKDAGLQRIKINCVVMKNHNADEVVALTQFALDHGIDIAFIEEMPLGTVTSHDRADEHFSSRDIRERLNRKWTLTPSTHSSGGPARYWQIRGYDSRIGFISPHSHNFCSTCNRVRVSAEGRLLLCLGNEHSVDLKNILRNTPVQQQQSALREAIIKSMALKPERHHFDLESQPDIVRFMNSTGG